MTCSCDWCATIARAGTIADKLGPEDAAWIWETMETLENTGMDLNWYEAITDGSWPESARIIRGWLEKVEAIHDAPQ